MYLLAGNLHPSIGDSNARRAQLTPRHPWRRIPFCIDGFNDGRPRLYVIATCMIAQIHDGMAEMNAIALVITILEQRVQLPTQWRW